MLNVSSRLLRSPLRTCGLLLSGSACQLNAILIKIRKDLFTASIPNCRCCHLLLQELASLFLLVNEVHMHGTLLLRAR